MKHARSQAGNVFFLILLGVALFAAFSVAVMRGQQGSGLNPEQDKLAATNIIRYGNTMKGAVDLIRSNGISESDISFANSTVTGYGTVGANAPAEVFNVSGGGIAYEVPNAKWLDGIATAQTNYGTWYFTGGNGVRDVGAPIGSTCVTAACQELIAILPYIKKEICQQINKQLGIAGGAILQDSGTYSVSSKYAAGNFSYSASIDDAGTDLNGMLSGCFEAGGTPATGTYHYLQVLIAR